MIRFQLTANKLVTLSKNNIIRSKVEKSFWTKVYAK